jgi:hypothetical protein
VTMEAVVEQVGIAHLLLVKTLVVALRRNLE